MGMFSFLGKAVDKVKGKIGGLAGGLAGFIPGGSMVKGALSAFGGLFGKKGGTKLPSSGGLAKNNIVASVGNSGSGGIFAIGGLAAGAFYFMNKR